LPVDFDEVVAAVVVAAVMPADVTLAFEETDAVAAPVPCPVLPATGTVVTVEKLLDEVAELLAVDAIVDDLDVVVEDLGDVEYEGVEGGGVECEDVEGGDIEYEDVEGGGSEEELDEPPSILMLFHDPDISLYTYSAPPVE
jgi:hypothetical protein